MADLSPGEQAIFLLCEGTAWTCIYFSFEAFKGGEAGQGTLFGILAVLFAVAGVQWPNIKAKLSRRIQNFGSGIEHIASDYRYRTGAILTVLLGIAIALSSFLQSLRKDVDTYLIPRTLTEAQSKELSRAVAGIPSDIKINILYSSWDLEATEYAGQLFTAIRSSGWDIQMQPINLWNPRDQPDNPFNHFILS